MSFSMLLPRTPLGTGAESKKEYQQAIRKEAKVRYTDEPLDGDNLYVRIVWFARKKGGADVDNIFKRILDALKEIVYLDDGQIRQCLATKIELAKPYTLSTRHIPDDLYGRLEVLLDSSDSDILFIEVGHVTSQEVVFGEIDRSAI